jgi:uncharacterized protein DUF1573/peptidase C39-like protein
VRRDCGLALLTLAVAGGCVLLFVSSQSDHTTGPIREPQCGHWAMLRCCRLLGVPMEMKTIRDVLPPDENGHSLQRLADEFHKLGLRTEGRHETFETLIGGNFPCIAHLKDPDHFVVLCSVEQDCFHMFDGEGRRKSRPVDMLTSHWSGNVLWVGRRRDHVPLPVGSRRQGEVGPCIQFDTLLLDKGNVYPIGEPLSFAFPFRNVGSEGLVIEDVRTSCTCIEVKKPEGPIPPGGDGRIELLYRVRSEAGPFAHTAVVRSNAPELPWVKLDVGGNVCTGVRVRPDHLNLGEIVAGEAGHARFFVQADGDWSGNVVEGVTSTLEGATFAIGDTEDRINPTHLALKGAKRVSTPPNTEVVKMCLRPQNVSPSRINGTIFVHTSVPGYERISVAVSGHVVLPVATYPSIINFGELADGVSRRQTVIIRSRVQKQFRILNIVPDCKQLNVVPADSNWHDTREIEFETNGSAARALNWSNVRINVELADSGDTYSIVLPIRIWPAAHERAR